MNPPRRYIIIQIKRHASISYTARGITAEYRRIHIAQNRDRALVEQKAEEWLKTGVLMARQRKGPKAHPEFPYAKEMKRVDGKIFYKSRARDPKMNKTIVWGHFSTREEAHNASVKFLETGERKRGKHGAAPGYAYITEPDGRRRATWDPEEIETAKAKQMVVKLARDTKNYYIRKAKGTLKPKIRGVKHPKPEVSSEKSAAPAALHQSIRRRKEKPLWPRKKPKSPEADRTTDHVCTPAGIIEFPRQKREPKPKELTRDQKEEILYRIKQAQSRQQSKPGERVFSESLNFTRLDQIEQVKEFLPAGILVEAGALSIDTPNHLRLTVAHESNLTSSAA